MLITRALYGLKLAGVVFRFLLSEVLLDLGYEPSKADPDVYMRFTIKSNCTKYW